MLASAVRTFRENVDQVERFLGNGKGEVSSASNPNFEVAETV
jgi:hypothetical protein